MQNFVFSPDPALPALLVSAAGDPVQERQGRPELEKKLDGVLARAGLIPAMAA